jgi:prepilin-type N-terminal cleavage/methylation domain-containing protein
MLNKLKKSNTQGFTIIEVMIVLAIAGLIILVVLLAVPAVQRNARNTAIKNDASAIAGGLSEFSSNNNGDQPLAGNSSQNGTTLTLNNATPNEVATTVKVQGSDVVTYGAATVAAVTGVAGHIYVDFGVSCASGATASQGTAAPTFTPATKSARATAIIYSTEVSGGLEINCLDS